MKQYITIGFESTFFKIDICDFDYNIALNIIKQFYYKEQINSDNINMEEDVSVNSIYEILTIDEVFRHDHPIYDTIQHLDENHFEKLLNNWDKCFGSYFNQNLITIKQNYKKYIDEAIKF